MGDRKTPDYFLNNTGTRESNLAIQLEKELPKNWNAELYYSAFNTTLGVLRGSHIGNLSDLENALERDVPFFTEDEFSYEIDAPKQVVNHHLLKAKLNHKLSESSFLNIIYGGQLNKRKEYDVRRQNFEDRPALSLRQYSNYAEVNLKHRAAENINYNLGFQLNIVDNENIPETNIFPLIPDYVSIDGGSFFTFDHTEGKWGYEGGLRYGYIYQSVAALTKTSPISIKRYKNNFHNISLSGGLNYWVDNHLKTTWNLGITTRNPAINELYSNGLHQGVSGIEEGNTNLTSETSLKSTLALEGDISQKFFFNSLIYYNKISDYIYLKPENEVRLTIRGAFPVFRYTQTDAAITGMDIMTYIEPFEGLNLSVKYSLIHARDIIDDLPLINIPSNTLEISFGYEINELSIFKNILLEIRNQRVFRQDQAISSLDFTPIPEGYNLFHAKISARREIKNKVFSFYARAENLFNKSFRNYLNRQRYFADDLGRNITLGVNFKF
jgi:iron complex outermembrane receptor protein